MAIKILIILFCVGLCQGLCPPESITSPCICKNNTLFKVLICVGNEFFDTSVVSQRISQHYINVTERRFEELEINNPMITTLGENAFNGLIFSRLNIKRIEKIHENAFSASKSGVKSILLENASIGIEPSPYNIFNWLNSMSSLKYFWSKNTNLNEIPANLLNLPNICIFEADNLIKVNNYSYNLMTNCLTLYLIVSGDYNFIPSHAFVTKSHSLQSSLTINFRHSQLNGSSFASDVFINPKRTLYLDFQNNTKLTYLEEKIFAPLFSNYPDSVVSLKGCPLDCDNCNFKWIIERKDDVLPKIFYASCTNGRSLENYSYDNFQDCTGKSTISTIGTPFSTSEKSTISTIATPFSTSEKSTISTIGTPFPSSEKSTISTIGTPFPSSEKSTISTIGTTGNSAISTTGTHNISTGISTVTVSTVRNTICNKDGIYDHIFGISWPPVDFGETSVAKCKYGNDYAYWLCSENGQFEGDPDLEGCILEKIANQAQNIEDISQAQRILDEFMTYTEVDDSLTNGNDLNFSFNITTNLQNFVTAEDLQINYEEAMNITTSFIQLFSNLLNQSTAWNIVSDEEKTETALGMLKLLT